MESGASRNNKIAHTTSTAGKYESEQELSF
jgi:hypothetical protein